MRRLQRARREATRGRNSNAGIRLRPTWLGSRRPEQSSILRNSAAAPGRRPLNQSQPAVRWPHRWRATGQASHPQLPLSNPSRFFGDRHLVSTFAGTGYYKVPSLNGLWYRGPFGHSGSIATLEDWFDPARLRDDYVPTGFAGVGGPRPVPGHEFGLRLPAEDKRALIAFLRTCFEIQF